MHSLLLSGILFAWVFVFVGVGGFSLYAKWLRQEKTEYVLFSALCAALALYTTGIGLFYYFAADRALWLTQWRLWSGVSAVGGVLSYTLGAHLFIHFAHLAREPKRLVLRCVYGFAAIFIALGVSGHWWQGVPDPLLEVRLGPLHLPCAPLHPSPLAQLFYIVVALGALSLCGVQGRAFLRDRRPQGLFLLIASVLLAIAVNNDVWIVMGKVTKGVYLTPFGALVFVFALCLLWLTHSDALSIGLERRRHELRKRTQDLRKRTQELRRSYQELQKAQNELVRKEQLAVVGELAAVIAHEVRNPLAIILNAVANLRKRDTSLVDRLTLFTIVDEEASRLNRLVSDLLRYARPINPHKKSIAVMDLLERTLTLAKGYPDMRIDLCVADTPLISADANLLRQVFDNLVGNALQAMAGKGLLTVGISPSYVEGKEGVAIKIQDTGEGMDPHVQNRARTPFFTTRPSGTGLGLAIVDRILEAHGGAMSLQSRPGEGTLVTVFLPYCPSIAHPLTAKSQTPLLLSDEGLASSPSSYPRLEREERRAL